MNCAGDKPCTASWKAAYAFGKLEAGGLYSPLTTPGGDAKYAGCCDGEAAPGPGASACPEANRVNDRIHTCSATRSVERAKEKKKRYELKGRRGSSRVQPDLSRNQTYRESQPSGEFHLCGCSSFPVDQSWLRLVSPGSKPRATGSSSAQSESEQKGPECRAFQQLCPATQTGRCSPGGNDGNDHGEVLFGA